MGVLVFLSGAITISAACSMRSQLIFSTSCAGMITTQSLCHSIWKLSPELIICQNVLCDVLKLRSVEAPIIPPCGPEFNCFRDAPSASQSRRPIGGRNNPPPPPPHPPPPPPVFPLPPPSHEH